MIGIEHDMIIPKHIIPDFAIGEMCRCGKPATHKIAEVLPTPYDMEITEWLKVEQRHEFNSYVCCECFCKAIPQARKSCGI